jgi:hypothetical protein
VFRRFTRRSFRKQGRTQWRMRLPGRVGSPWRQAWLGAAATGRGHMAAPMAPVFAAAIAMAAILAAAVPVAPILAALGSAAGRLHPAARGGRAARGGGSAGRSRASRSGTARSRTTTAHLAAAIAMAAVPAAAVPMAPIPAALGSAAGRLAPAHLLTPAATTQHGKQLPCLGLGRTTQHTGRQRSSNQSALHE